MASDVTGTVTAVGNTVVAECTSNDPNVFFHLYGTHSGVSLAFEGSFDGNVWASLPVTQSQATSGTPTAAVSNLVANGYTVYGGSTIGYRYVRVRCTAITSGTLTVTAVRGATGLLHTVMGRIDSAYVMPLAPSVSGMSASAASTNSVLIRGGAGRIVSGWLTNISASTRYFKFYDKATAPTVGTDVPVIVIPVAANSAVPIDAWISCSLGIGMAITGGAADTDTTAIGAGDCKMHCYYY